LFDWNTNQASKQAVANPAIPTWKFHFLTSLN